MLNLLPEIEKVLAKQLGDAYGLQNYTPEKQLKEVLEVRTDPTGQSSYTIDPRMQTGQSNNPNITIEGLPERNPSPPIDQQLAYVSETPSTNEKLNALGNNPPVPQPPPVKTSLSQENIAPIPNLENNNTVNNSQVKTPPLSQENIAPIPNLENNNTVNNSQVEPTTGTQYADNQTMVGLENKKNFLAGINPENYGFIRNIANSKNIYENADNLAKMYQAQGYDVTGDMLRQQAHDSAEYARKLADAEGIGLGAWGNGGGVSTDESNFALDRYNYRQAKDAQEKFENTRKQLDEDYLQSSQQYFEERYDYYRSRHKSQRDSIILAGRETRQYAKDRVRFLRNAIKEYGIDNGVAMNQFGISALGELATEDAIMGSVYAKAFATPKENYYKMLEAQQQDKQSQEAMARLIENINAQNRRAEMIQDRTDARTQATIDAELAKNDTNETGRNNRANADREHSYNMQERKYQWEIELEKAKAWLKNYYGKLNDIKSGKGSVSDKDKKAMLDDLKLQKDTWEDRLERAKQEEADKKSIYQTEDILKAIDEIEQNILTLTNQYSNFEWEEVKNFGSRDIRKLAVEFPNDYDALKRNAEKYLMVLSKNAVSKEELDEFIKSQIPDKAAQRVFYDIVRQLQQK